MHICLLSGCLAASHSYRPTVVGENPLQRVGRIAAAALATRSPPSAESALPRVKWARPHVDFAGCGVIVEGFCQLCSCENQSVLQRLGKLWLDE